MSILSPIVPAMPAAGMGQGQHFQDGVAAIRQPFVVFDADERLAAYNRAFDDLHRDAGGAPVLYPGMSFQELMEWRLRTGFFAQSPESDGEFHLKHGDVIYQLRDGRWMFVDNTALPDGRLCCTWSDITRVKQAERQMWELSQSLRRSQEHLVRAQRIAHVGSLERDLCTGTVRWTPEMYVIFGRDPGEAPPARDGALLLFHPDDRARYEAVMRAAEEGRPTPPEEFRVLRPDGTIRWVYHESEIVRDAAGAPARRVGIYRDVTEIHEYQEQQRALQDELLIKERLSAVGAVTATVAHELRNPLSTIKNSLFTLRGEAAEGRSPSERLLARMERSIDRCNRIISDLLEYSRVSPLRLRAQTIDDWLREAVAAQGLPEDVSVTSDLDAAGAVVELDTGRLRRAVANVLENAVHAAAESAGGGARIAVRTRRDGHGVAIEIEDNGPGINADVAAHAFDPLFSTRAFGTGLGLPTARQIVEQHGGSIELANRPGGGACAVIRLPLVDVAAT